MSKSGYRPIPLRPNTPARYHALYDPPPPRAQIQPCPECGEFIYAKPDKWLEVGDDEVLREHAHQPPITPPPPPDDDASPGRSAPLP